MLAPFSIPANLESSSLQRLDLESLSAAIMQYGFQGLIVVAIACALLRLLARDDARSRRRVLMTAFVGLLLLAPLAAVLPDHLTVSLTNPLLPPEIVSAPLDTDVETYRTVPFEAAPRLATSAPAAMAADRQSEDHQSLLLNSVARASESSDHGNAAVPTPSSRSITGVLLVACFALWLIGASLLFLRWLVALLQLRTLIRGSVTLQEMSAGRGRPTRYGSLAASASKQADRDWRQGWQDSLDRARDELGLIRTIELRFAQPHHDPIEGQPESSPCTFGFLTPRILLPASADQWDESRRRVVLLHELGHIKNHDWLSRRMAQLACALHWFNPLVWLALDQLKLEQENSCDRVVLEAGVKPSEYARHLLELVASMRHVSPTSTLAMIERSKNTPTRLEARLMNILDSSTDPSRGRRLLSLSIPAALISVLLVPLVAAIELQPKQETTPRAVSVPSVDEFTEDDYAIATPPMPEAPTAARRGVVVPSEATVPRTASPRVAVVPRVGQVPRAPEAIEWVTPSTVPAPEMLKVLPEFAASFPSAPLPQNPPLPKRLGRVAPVAPTLPAALAYAIAPRTLGESDGLNDEEAARLHEELQALTERHNDLAEQLHERLSSIFDGQMHEAFETSMQEMQKSIHERLQSVHGESHVVDEQAMAAIHRRMEDAAAAHAQRVEAHAHRLEQIRHEMESAEHGENRDTLRAQREVIRHEMEQARAEFRQRTEDDRRKVQNEMETLRQEMVARSEKIRAEIEPMREEMARQAERARIQARELRQRSEDATREFRSEMREVEREIERTSRQLRDLQSNRREIERRDGRHDRRRDARVAPRVRVPRELDGEADGRSQQPLLRE